MSVKRHSNGLTEQENIIHKSLSASQNVGVKKEKPTTKVTLYESPTMNSSVICSRMMLPQKKPFVPLEVETETEICYAGQMRI